MAECGTREESGWELGAGNRKEGVGALQESSVISPTVR